MEVRQLRLLWQSTSAVCNGATRSQTRGLNGLIYGSGGGLSPDDENQSPVIADNANHTRGLMEMEMKGSQGDAGHPFVFF